MDKNDFLTEVYRQINNTTFYWAIQYDPAKHIASVIKMTVKEGVTINYTTENMAKYLINDFLRTPIFYILPKIHKPGTPSPGRPIISGCGSLL